MKKIFNNKLKMEPLNLEGLYDIIILGGGPAVLGFLINAYR